MEPEILPRAGLALLLTAFAAHRACCAGPFPGVFRRPKEASGRGAAGAVFRVLGTAATLLALGYIARPELIAWAGLPLPGPVRWAGMGAGLAGLCLLHVAQRALGAGWTAGTAPAGEEHLITVGPYRRVRHPIYTALLLISGATFLISANWLVGAAWVATTGADVARRVRREEVRLRKRFGRLYEDHARATGRFLPRLRRRAR